MKLVKNDHPCDRCGGKPEKDFNYIEVLHHRKTTDQEWVGVLCKRCHKKLLAFLLPAQATRPAPGHGGT